MSGCGTTARARGLRSRGSATSPTPMSRRMRRPATRRCARRRGRSRRTMTLRRHIAMNGLDNVTVVELAAWDEQTMLALDDPNGQIEGGSMRVIPAERIAAPGHLVPAGRLDEQLELTSLDRLDLVKLDV